MSHIREPETFFDKLPDDISKRIRLNSCLLELDDKYDRMIHKIRLNKCMKELELLDLKFEEDDRDMQLLSLHRVLINRFMINTRLLSDCELYIRITLDIPFGWRCGNERFKPLISYISNETLLLPNPVYPQYDGYVQAARHLSIEDINVITSMLNHYYCNSETFDPDPEERLPLPFHELDASLLDKYFEDYWIYMKNI